MFKSHSHPQHSTTITIVTKYFCRLQNPDDNLVNTNRIMNVTQNITIKIVSNELKTKYQKSLHKKHCITHPILDNATEYIK